MVVESNANALCAKCQKACKQSSKAKVLQCRRYQPVPVQLELKFEQKSSRKK